MIRQIVLDTETTGLETKNGHRLIEIGCVELISRRFTGNDWHFYINPEREIDKEAEQVHGISSDFLQDKPKFQEVANNLLEYLKDAELIIHNAAFDIGFLQYEYNLLGKNINFYDKFKVTDSLKLARETHPGQKNNLDALCKRYNIDNSNREKHGALLDAMLLAEVYLAMTGGQVSLDFGFFEAATKKTKNFTKPANLPVITANQEEITAHEEHLGLIQKKSNGECIWLL